MYRLSGEKKDCQAIIYKSKLLCLTISDILGKTNLKYSPRLVKIVIISTIKIIDYLGKLTAKLTKECRT